MVCIKVSVCIWPGVMVSDRREWISLQFIWHITSNKTQSSKRQVTLQVGQEYLSLVHDVLLLFMSFLVSDLSWL